jgi:hypothetical protein
VQTGRLGVESFEPRRHAGDAFAAARELGDLLENAADDGLDALDAARFRRAGDFVDGLLGAVDELLHLADVAVSLRGDALARRDELADAPFLTDHPGIGLEVRDGRDGVDELCEIGTAPHLS